MTTLNSYMPDNGDDEKQINTEVSDLVDDLMDYHAPDEEQIKKMKAIRKALGDALKVVLINAPSSADRTVAIRCIREARMNANSAIIFHGKY